MQYIKKLNTPPADWDKWFTTTTGVRSYDYGHDFGILREISKAKDFLLEEQHMLCAYCQKKLECSEASIEHVVPKEHNKELSTNYYNLVAVCASPPKDEDGKLHCDKEKASRLITPFIFVANSDVTTMANNTYFTAGEDGVIRPRVSKQQDHVFLSTAFIETVNLNHLALINRRRQNALYPLIDIRAKLPIGLRPSFWQRQFDRIMADKTLQDRQYLLMVLSQKLGRY